MSLLAQAWRAVWSHTAGRVAALVLATIALVALFGPLLLPDPSAQPDILNGALRSPAADHPFGTDQLSRACSRGWSPERACRSPSRCWRRSCR